MERIKNSIQMYFVTRLKSLEVVSDQLAFFERLRSWKDLLEYPKRIEAVTRESIPEIAERYFSPELKTIGFLLQKENDRSDKDDKGEDY
jgi:predicted Zn-dependent peptidase